MNRRIFTLAGFFGAIGSALGTVFGKTQGYDSPPAPIPATSEPQVNLWGYLSDHTIKVGRKIMRVNPDNGAWEVYADTAETAARLNETADVMGAIDHEVWSSMSADYRSQFAPPQPRQRLTLPPEGIKRWTETPDVLKPEYSTSFPAKISMLHDLLGKLEALQQPPFTPDARELRERIRDLEQEIRLEIQVRATMCDGHNGPTPLGEMTEMLDGRRLCPYCHKQEIDHELQFEGSERDQTPSV